MKKHEGLVLLVLVGLLVSCASTGGTLERAIPQSDVGNYDIIGHVTVTYKAAEGTRADAYPKLLEEAKKQYSGNIDVMNIKVDEKFVGLAYGVTSTTAIGDVVISKKSQNQYSAGVEGALTRAAQQTLKNVPPRSRIAIVYITAQDRSTTEYVVGELEYIWVNEGYFITDRSQLDQLRREQKFGMSGEVDDKTAASIGKIAGASVIVTGRVDGEGELRRLRLRALDSETAQVLGVASEKL